VRKGVMGLYELLDAKQRGEANRIEGEGEEKGETFFCVYCAGLLALLLSTLLSLLKLVTTKDESIEKFYTRPPKSLFKNNQGRKGERRRRV
jgi:hypothetical protein